MKLVVEDGPFAGEAFDEPKDQPLGGVVHCMVMRNPAVGAFSKVEANYEVAEIVAGVGHLREKRV